MKKKEQELSIFPSKSSAKKAEATTRRMGNFTNKILENLVRARLPQYVFEPSMLVVLLFDLLLQSESIFSIANIALLIHGCEAAGRKKKKKRKFVNQGRDHTQITPKKRGNSSRELMKSSQAKKIVATGNSMPSHITHDGTATIFDSFWGGLRISEKSLNFSFFSYLATSSPQ